eukprot:gene16801-biopygen2268
MRAYSDCRAAITKGSRRGSRFGAQPSQAEVATPTASQVRGDHCANAVQVGGVHWNKACRPFGGLLCIRGGFCCPWSATPTRIQLPAHDGIQVPGHDARQSATCIQAGHDEWPRALAPPRLRRHPCPLPFRCVWAEAAAGAAPGARRARKGRGEGG